MMRRPIARSIAVTLLTQIPIMTTTQRDCYAAEYLILSQITVFYESYIPNDARNPIVTQGSYMFSALLGYTNSYQNGSL